METVVFNRIWTRSGDVWFPKAKCQAILETMFHLQTICHFWFIKSGNRLMDLGSCSCMFLPIIFSQKIVTLVESIVTIVTLMYLQMNQNLYIFNVFQLSDSIQIFPKDSDTFFSARADAVIWWEKEPTHCQRDWEDLVKVYGAGKTSPTNHWKCWSSPLSNTSFQKIYP